MLDKDGKEIVAEEGGDDVANPEGGEKPTPGLIEMTQDQLKDRLDRKGTSATTALLKELGIEDIEVAKASLLELKTLQDAKLTADERVQQELAAAQKLVATKTAEADAAKVSALNSTLQIRAYEAMQALEKPFVDPSAALRLTDLSGVVKDGNIDATALGEALQATAAKHPWALVSPSTVTPGANAGNPPDPDTEAVSDAQRMATYFGGAGKQGEFFQGGGVVVPE